MSLSTLKSPLAFYHAKTWDGIPSYSFMICFPDTELHGPGAKTFAESFSMSGCHTQLILMTFQTSCIRFKSRKSLGHSNTGVSLITKMLFAVLELIQRTLPCVYISSFHILYWHNKPYRRGLDYHEDEM